MTQAGAGWLAGCPPPGPSLLFIPAEVLSVFELALPIYMLEPEAVHDVCPRTLKPMSWRLGRENVSLSFLGALHVFFQEVRSLSSVQAC